MGNRAVSIRYEVVYMKTTSTKKVVVGVRKGERGRERASRARPR